MMIVSWNTTNECNLKCNHCYRDAGKRAVQELSTQEGKTLLEGIARAGGKLMVFSGGEPLMRKDILELVSHARKLGLRPVLGTNGTLLTEKMARDLVAAGAAAVAISVHMLDPRAHDEFCGVQGAWEAGVRGIDNCIKAGLPVQINTTVTKRNYKDILGLIDFAIAKGARSQHILFLVPTGRGEYMEDESLHGPEYERLIRDILKKRQATKFDVKPTCAPHFIRLADRLGIDTRYTRGCLAGISYCSIIPDGDVWPCPYLPVKVGNVREKPFDQIWKDNDVLRQLRTIKYKGKCGQCEYAPSCGGCRARSYFYHGDIMDSEPWCLYKKARQPK